MSLWIYSRSRRGENESVESGSIGKQQTRTPHNPNKYSTNDRYPNAGSPPPLSSTAAAVPPPKTLPGSSSFLSFSPSFPSSPDPLLTRSLERFTRQKWPQSNLPINTTSSSLEVAAVAPEELVAPPRTERKSRSSKLHLTTEALALTSVRVSG